MVMPNYGFNMLGSANNYQPITQRQIDDTAWQYASPALKAIAQGRSMPGFRLQGREGREMPQATLQQLSRLDPLERQELDTFSKSYYGLPGGINTIQQQAQQRFGGTRSSAPATMMQRRPMLSRAMGAAPQRGMGFRSTALPREPRVPRSPMPSSMPRG
jgi:hypothetical protein